MISLSYLLKIQTLTKFSTDCNLPTIKSWYGKFLHDVLITQILTIGDMNPLQELHHEIDDQELQDIVQQNFKCKGS